jgi:hypothetical protein
MLRQIGANQPLIEAYEWGLFLFDSRSGVSCVSLFAKD